jgi:aminoglycoside 6'-N-acetyltransferase
VAEYSFRRVTHSDLPMLAAWLKQVHVSEWWGDPAKGLGEIEAGMDDPACDLYVVLCDGRPLGYQQSWDPHAEPDHPCRDQPPGTRGIDQFIGEAGMLGRGHGTAFIRLFTERLLAAGAPRVITDPNPRNLRAIRAYMKAGFVPAGNRTTISGDALLMTCEA